MRSNAGPLRIINTLMCEDVRHEVNNKYSAIGIISGDLLINVLPAQIAVAFYIEAEAEANQYVFELKVSGPGEGSVIFKAEVDHPQGGNINLAFSRFEVLAECPGTFRLDLKVDGEGWFNLISKKFMLNDQPNA